ncbi:uncharacterized protein [Solanum lycopersicum]|uniref:uncharacterized protein n=1 Tax=Solanum lycopersicum TaxID=4081 RepID=UPI0002BCBC50
MEPCDATNLLARNKLGFIDGRITRDDFTVDFEKQDWDRCNAMVISLIINNISKELVSGILFFSNASVVWRDIKERFDKVNLSRIYHLHKAIATLTQGLNGNYSQAHSKILMMMSVPSVNQCYAMIIQDENQKVLYGEKLGNNTTIDYTALLSKEIEGTGKPRRGGYTGNTGSSSGGGNTCGFGYYSGYYGCNGSGSGVFCGSGSGGGASSLGASSFRSRRLSPYYEICYPADFKGKRKIYAGNVQNQHTGDDGVTPHPHHVKQPHFIMDQYNQILRLLNKPQLNDASTNANMTVARTRKVQIPKGESAMITHSGKCQLEGGDVITDALFNGKVKGIGEERDGLYTLNTNIKEESVRIKSLNVAECKETAELWHKRMGHAPMQVKVLRSDNGGEFFNTQCKELFDHHGIVHQSSCLHTPQQNGVLERKHRHILETDRAIPFQDADDTMLMPIFHPTKIAEEFPIARLGECDIVPLIDSIRTETMVEASSSIDPVGQPPIRRTSTRLSRPPIW